MSNIWTSLGDWVMEVSSGYAGRRCRKCATWKYESEKLVCDCDKDRKLTPGQILYLTPEYQLKSMVKDVIAFRRTCRMEDGALAVLADRLVKECGVDADNCMRVAEEAVIWEVLQRFPGVIR